MTYKAANATKITVGKDKIEIAGGTLTEGKANGSNVELTTSGGKITIKGVVGKVIEVDDVKYKFAKTTKSLEESASKFIPIAIVERKKK